MKFKPKDFLLMEIACKVGGFTYSLTQKLGYNNKRIKQLEKEGYVYRKIANEKQADGTYKKRYWYTLQDKGKEICSKKSYWTNFINVNNNAYTHTKKAQEVYLKLKEQGYTAQQILNENEQRYNVFKKDIEHLKNREIKFSVADLCVISNTGEIEKFVEIVTENYTEKQIQNKKNYVDHFNADYEIY